MKENVGISVSNSFIRSWQILSYLKTPPRFTEIQRHTLPSYFFNIYFNIIFPSYFFQVLYFFQALQPKFCNCFPSRPHTP